MHMPKELQTVDLSRRRVFNPDTFTRAEYELYSKLKEGENIEEMVSHPLIAEIEERIKREVEEIKEPANRVKQ
jgi:hypothetical protein